MIHLILLGISFFVFIWFGISIFKRYKSEEAFPQSGYSKGSTSTGESKGRCSFETANYKDVFPQTQKVVTQDDLSIIKPYADRQKKPLPFDVPYYEADHNCVSPTGYLVKDILRFNGDFPDYATLSGVPAPEAWEDFGIERVLPRPYRPLRWAYHQTMSLTKMEPNWWLELESTYTECIQQRVKLVQKHGTDVMDILPGTELACKELMEMSIQFLCARYPNSFSLDKTQGLLHNKILKTTADLKTAEPLEVLLHNIPEDFCIMIRDPATGMYHFRGGIICSSIGWNLSQKLGLRLHKIHEPVPDYKEKMAFSLDKFFAKLAVDCPIQRGSWAFELYKPLYVAPGEHHPNIDDVSDQGAEEQIHFRVDWQTLRRLPLSGAIVFTFRPLYTPLRDLRKEAYVPSLALKVLRYGPGHILDYKGVSRTSRIVMAALERFEKEQIAAGMIPADWKVQTLEESPFFPGWKAKWIGDMARNRRQ